MAKRKAPPESLGQRIRRLRIAKGTQSAFAKSTGIPVGTVRNFEQDRVLPTLPNLVIIALALGVDAGDLLRGVVFECRPAKRGRPKRKETS